MESVSPAPPTSSPHSLQNATVCGPCFWHFVHHCQKAWQSFKIQPKEEKNEERKKGRNPTNEPLEAGLPRKLLLRTPPPLNHSVTLCRPSKTVRLLHYMQLLLSFSHPSKCPRITVVMEFSGLPRPSVVKDPCFFVALFLAQRQALNMAVLLRKASFCD